MFVDVSGLELKGSTFLTAFPTESSAKKKNTTVPIGRRFTDLYLQGNRTYVQDRNYAWSSTCQKAVHVERHILRKRHFQAGAFFIPSQKEVILVCKIPAS